MVNDPQLAARSMLIAMPHPLVPDLKVPTSPLKLADTPPTVRRYPPALGEHNEEVLAELGYSEKDMDGLNADGVL